MAQIWRTLWRNLIPPPESQAMNRRGRRGQQVFIAGLIIAIRIKQGQKGKMAFVTIDDRSARTEVRFFAKSFEKAQHLLAQDKVIIVRGKCVYDDFADAFRVNADDTFAFAEARETCAEAIQISTTAETEAKLVPLLQSQLSEEEQGGCQVFIDVTHQQSDGQQVSGKLQLPERYKLNLSEDCYNELKLAFGKEQIQIKFNLDKLPSEVIES